MEVNQKQIKIIDRLIIFFTVLFLLSLTNSIFVNQIGYFGSLVLILIRYFLTKENQFKKTGLELIFVWFLLAELMSAIFSGNNPQAYLYLSKRALLIPLVYTAIAVALDEERVKKYFKIYIGASLITVLIYLFFSFKYYINNLYNIKESGPSLFQYPITASEITSFTVLFLFAFAINEKTKLLNKILLTLGFLVSLVALVSTYKRTGWIGVAAGIFVILLLKKQWKVLIPICLAVVFLFLYSKNISRVEFYNFNNSKLKFERSVKTKGFAYSALADSNKTYISDFTEGILVYKDTSLIKKIKLPAPVYSLTKWDNYFVASSVDTRFFLLQKSGDDLKIKNEFLTAGLTISYAAANNFFYTVDLDSGLTIFKNPLNLSDTVRLSSYHGYTAVCVDSNYLVMFQRPNTLTVLKLQNGLPVNESINYSDKSNIDRFFYIDKKILASDKQGLKLFSIENDSLRLIDQNKTISGIYTWNFSDNRLFAASSKGNFYELQYPVGNNIKIIFKDKLSSQPESIAKINDNLVFTFAKESRLLSIFDFYNPSNRVRIELWKAGLKMFRDHPIFGVGDIDLSQMYIKYKHNYDKEIQGHMHNNFVHELATLGLFGFLAFCFLIIKIIIIDLKIYRETKDKPFISSYALGAIGGFCAFLVSGLTEFNFGDQEIITLVWFTFGFNLALYYFSKKQISQTNI
ncbi:MAG: O-antigen ligase family protein [Bacteroidetes bacterium]|nr:O-antigen ligase family protein [Bacteroidota bacterium]